MKALLLYVPVIHKGHLDLVARQNPDVLYVLGSSFKAEFSLLERDLRALSPVEIAKQAQAINLASDIRILERDALSELEQYDEIVLTEDEVGEELRKRYFPNKSVTIDTAFIRWNAIRSISKDVPDADQTISESELDRELMKEARSAATTSPDWWRQVGSLIARDGRVLLKGCNKHYPSSHTSYIDGDPRSNFNAGERIDVSLALHGEAGLIAEAARRGLSLDGASIYVTTFPCPNCAMLIAKSGVKKVYYADGYSLLNAQETFKQSGIEIIKVK